MCLWVASAPRQGLGPGPSGPLATLRGRAVTPTLFARPALTLGPLTPAPGLPQCSLQGLIAQRLVLGPTQPADEYHGPDVEAIAGAARDAKDEEALANGNDVLGSSASYLRGRDIAGNGSEPAQMTHGRGIMVDREGNYVMWSRDGEGMWRGVVAGQCVPGKWSHLALVQKGDVLTAFMDGAKRKHVQMKGHQGPAYVPYYTVGRLTDGRSAAFYTANGLVDEVRVYERDLSPQDVRCGANTRITGRERGIAAYLRMDEGAGTTLISTAHATEVSSEVVGGAPRWISASGFRKVEISPEAPDAKACEYDMSVVDTVGIHMARLKEGQGCPNECSGNGKCDLEKGTCLCNPGFVEEDCSVSNYQGYALSFDGKMQYVVLPPMGLHNSMQLEAWLKLSDVAGANPVRVDTDMEVEGAVAWEIQDGKVQLTVTGAEPATQTFDYTLEAETWYLVSVAYSKKHAEREGTGSATLYINGKPESVVEYTNTVGVQLGAAWLGARKFASTYFSGLMDEVRIFARVSPPKETAYVHAAARLEGNELGLLAYYSFDERGDLALDRTRTAGSGRDREFATTTSDVPSEMNARVLGEAPRVISDAPFLPCIAHCNMQGMCWNGTCECEEWFGGRACQKLMCPNYCSGNGHCVLDNSTMRYAEILALNISSAAENTTGKLYAEDIHRIATRDSLLYNLTANVANTTEFAVRGEVRRAIEEFMARTAPKKCQCADGFFGPDCSARQCLNDCSGHGICVNGTCGCEDRWGGVDCSEKRCINGCSGHGECYDGTCICDAGWTGDDCATKPACSGGCNGHGVCLDDACDCDDGWTGDQCEWGSGCPNFCSGRGRCVDNQCMCDKMFSGPDCGDVRCPRDCSGHGDCVDGTCYCEAGFSGGDCSQSSLWPMRCHAVRRGKRTTTQCKRGWVLATPPIGSQVLEIQYGEANGAKAFEGTLSEQDQPTVTDAKWSKQARAAGEELARLFAPSRVTEATGAQGEQGEEEEG